MMGCGGGTRFRLRGRARSHGRGITVPEGGHGLGMPCRDGALDVFHDPRSSPEPGVAAVGRPHAWRIVPRRRPGSRSAPTPQPVHLLVLERQAWLVRPLAPPRAQARSEEGQAVRPVPLAPPGQRVHSYRTVYRIVTPGGLEGLRA